MALQVILFLQIQDIIFLPKTSDKKFTKCDSAREGEDEDR